MDPTTAIFLNKTTPPPATGRQNVEFATNNATPQQSVTASDPVFVGDTGSGGLAGNVPAPVAGDAASGKVLSAKGLFDNPRLSIGFIFPGGSAGVAVNAGPMLPARGNGVFTKCVVVTKKSDLSTALTFRIKQNGTDIFSSDPTIAASTASGTLTTFTTLTSTPLPVALNDIFSIDITSGSVNWDFTAELQ